MSDQKKNTHREEYEALRAQKIAGELTRLFTENKTVAEASKGVLEEEGLNDELVAGLSSPEAHGKAFDALRGRDKAADVGKLVASLEKTPAGGKRNRILRWASVSAAAAALAFGVFFALRDNSPADTSSAYSIPPGEKMAVLTYSDGRTLDIDQAQFVLDESEETLAAGSAADADQPVTYTTVTIPRGKEFFLTLPDNTKVWLNSETELRIPSPFAGAERRVSLKGEAFFDVSKDPARPFVVDLDQGDITVYGTRFNVQRYAGSPLTAVLVEGSIGFRSSKGGEVMLEPSQMLEYDALTGNINVETVDISAYTSWIDNVFIFNRQDLSEILTILARWYDVQVVFEDESAREVVLSGRLDRSADMGSLLHAYEKSTDLRFRVDDKTIYVNRK